MASPKRYSTDNTRCGCGKKSDFKFIVFGYPLTRISKTRTTSTAPPVGVCRECVRIFADGVRGSREIKPTIEKLVSAMMLASNKAIHTLDSQESLATANRS
jgi:hypothetical protein